MKEKIQIFIKLTKEIGKDVIKALIVVGVLFLIGLIPSIRPYFLKLLFLIFTYWREILLLVEILLIIYLFYQIRRLFNSNNLLKKEVGNIPKSTSIDTITKKLSDLDNKIEGVQKVALKNITNYNDLEREVYEINRNYLYNEAEKHEKLGQRGALLCRLRVIDLDVEKDFDFNLEESLGDLFKYTKTKEVFSTQDLSAIKNCLNKIKNEGHKEVVEQILNQVKSKLI